MGGCGCWSSEALSSAQRPVEHGRRQAGRQVIEDELGGPGGIADGRSRVAVIRSSRMELLASRIEWNRVRVFSERVCVGLQQGPTGVCSSTPWTCEANGQPMKEMAGARRLSRCPELTTAPRRSGFQTLGFTNSPPHAQFRRCAGPAPAPQSRDTTSG